MRVGLRSQLAGGDAGAAFTWQEVALALALAKVLVRTRAPARVLLLWALAQAPGPGLATEPVLAALGLSMSSPCLSCTR